MTLINKYDFLKKLKISKYYNADDEYKSGFNDGIFHAEVTADHMSEMVDAIPVEFITDYVKSKASPYGVIVITDMMKEWLNSKYGLGDKKQIECKNCVKWSRETGRCFYGDWVKEPDDYCSWAVEKKG